MANNFSRRIPRLISDIRILISSYLRQELKNTGITGIAPSHGEILYNLMANGDMTMTELSTAITKDRSTVTALVGKLIEKNLVEYIENPEDMRSKKVRLTEESKLIKGQFINISNNMNKKLLNNISKEEMDIFTKVLLKIKSNFTNME